MFRSYICNIENLRESLPGGTSLRRRRDEEKANSFSIVFRGRALRLLG